jgi:hypothetical protein
VQERVKEKTEEVKKDDEMYKTHNTRLSFIDDGKRQGGR